MREEEKQAWLSSMAGKTDQEWALVMDDQKNIQLALSHSALFQVSYWTLRGLIVFSKSRLEDRTLFQKA